MHNISYVNCWMIECFLLSEKYIILYIEARKGMKPQAFNFLATPHQAAISSFRSSLFFFNPGVQINGSKKYGGNETWTALYFSRSSFEKRFASLATAFPPMSLRLHVPTTFIDFIGFHSCSVASRHRVNHAFSYYLKFQFWFYKKHIYIYRASIYIKLQKFSI